MEPCLLMVHELRFGSFITPVNARPQRVVDLAVLSEDAGLDVVTFQDHPYQSSFLDTWTLLSWVAARTAHRRVRQRAEPAAAPPRRARPRGGQPRPALRWTGRASGLGAGFYWDAVQAAGGRRLTPLQGVAALGEAIDVIRGIWDADGPGTLDADGEFYQVHGAERGPAPAHEIPIWLGAHKPKMQDLVGTQGRRLAAVAAGHGAGRPAQGKRDHRRRRTGRGPRPPRDHPPAQHLPGPADAGRHWPR